MFDQTSVHEFVLFIDRDPEPEMLRSNVRIARVHTRRSVTESAVAEGARSLADLMTFRRCVASEPLDVMYFPAVYSWYPTGGRAPVVITFHDAIAEHFPGLVFPRLQHRLLWNAKVWLAKQTAASITTVSCAARSELSRYLHIPSHRIQVILEAADSHFRPVTEVSRRAAMRERLGLDQTARLVVYVGGMAPHKNLLRLVEAFRLAIAHAPAQDLSLVFAGDPLGDGFHSNFEEIRARVQSDPLLASKVVFTGFVSDEDLVALYSDALMVAMPSLSEGFGLPAAEAIACGAPVIASRGGAVEEVVEAAGAYFDPLDIDDIAATITRLAMDPDRLQALRAACAPRARELSWAKAGAAMLDVLEACGARR